MAYIYDIKLNDLPLKTYLLAIVSMAGSLTSIPCVAEAFQAPKQANQLATDIADCYIRSFPSDEMTEEEAITHNHDIHKVRPPKLAERTKREVVFNRLFTKSAQYAWLQQNMAAILNEYAWGDLHLFYGTTSEPAYHLISRIGRTITTLGEGILATMLATPTSDIQELRKRQHMIQTFLKNTVAVDQLKASLRCYQEAEESVLSLWTSTDPLYTKEYVEYMNKKFYSKNSSNNNKNAGLLELKKRFFRDFWGIQLRFLWPVTNPILGEIFNGEGMSKPMFPNTNVTLREFYWKGATPYYGGWYKWDMMRKGAPELGRTFAIGGIVGEAYYTWTAYQGISNYREYSSVLRNLAARMADIQALVVAATEVSECIAASSMLEAVYGARITNIRALLEKARENTELGRLVHYLQTLSCSHWSYFFDNAGKLLASHKLFTEHKDAFADAMYELGELDAFVSMATLMQEAQEDPNSHSYTFAKFLDRNQRSKPYIHLGDMWNPFLDAKDTVGNSIVMDAAGGTRNIILTGPNAGGKSTFLTGVTINLLLSQTFGIAPAKEAVLTPFDRINTSIDITDDIAAGKSLFMAEVDRAQKHLNLLNGLKKDEFSFSIFDEPFSGTNPTEGAAAEYSILEAMAGYTNTLNIVATHYPVVMLLEEKRPELGFANYKVYITHRKGEKKLNYTYKVIPGKSNQAIAIDILEEQGYDIRFLKRAREIIEHPERYSSQF